MADRGLRSAAIPDTSRVPLFIGPRFSVFRAEIPMGGEQFRLIFQRSLECLFYEFGDRLESVFFGDSGAEG